jgi:festuclavine dehydrogenase
VEISEDEIVAGMATFSISAEYARLPVLDTAIKNGAEERVNSVVLDVTARAPRTLLSFIGQIIVNY